MNFWKYFGSIHKSCKYMSHNLEAVFCMWVLLYLICALMCKISHFLNIASDRFLGTWNGKKTTNIWFIYWEFMDEFRLVTKSHFITHLLIWGLPLCPLGVKEDDINNERAPNNMVGNGFGPPSHLPNQQPNIHFNNIILGLFACIAQSPCV